MRYACLGQAEISSSSDNKTAVYALMDKIEFDRERYRLGHTLVFFRAGALAGLEEARDGLVTKLNLIGKDIDLAIPLYSSEQVPLQDLKRPVMVLSSNGLDSCKERFSRESVLECLKRKEISVNSLR